MATKVIINEEQLEHCIMLESGYKNGGTIYANNSSHKMKDLTVGVSNAPIHSKELGGTSSWTKGKGGKFGSGPRGYRNNNPLNIRKSGSNWVGAVRPNTDGAFEQFETMGYGFRAAIKLIQNYIKRGYNTIEKIISRWAPPGDNNNTEAYIAHVVQRTHIKPDRVIGAGDKQAISKIVYAMAISENGSELPNMSDEIENGWKLLKK